MAKLRATIQGRRGEASRLGDDVIIAKVNSWARRVTVAMQDDSDTTVEVAPYSGRAPYATLTLSTPSEHKSSRWDKAGRKAYINRKWSGDPPYGGERWAAAFEAPSGEGIQLNFDPATGEYQVRLVGTNGVLLPPLAQGRLGTYLHYSAETHAAALRHAEKAEAI